MHVIEVTENRTARKFLALPRKIYRDDPNWICPLDNDIESIFDPRHNHFFSNGECVRWILEQKGEVCGRIAAFVNRNKAFKSSVPTGGIGFFECINNREAAFMLFDTAKQWLKEKGMKAAEAPVNFGENDRYWGLLVEGFKPPSIGMNYNPPYYINLFESYGFTKLYDQYTNILNATVPLPDRFIRIAEWVMQKPGYSFCHFDKKHYSRFANDFMEIYNDGWSDFENFSPISIQTIRDSFSQMKPVIDEKIIWFAYYNQDPAAFILCLPDINRTLKHLNGKMKLWGKLKFLWYQKTTKVKRIRIIAMGCKKKYQNHGLESALIRCLQKEVLPRNTITEVELAWVADWNKRMISLHQATGAVRDKTHRTYKYIFEH